MEIDKIDYLAESLIESGVYLSLVSTNESKK